MSISYVYPYFNSFSTHTAELIARRLAELGDEFEDEVLKALEGRLRRIAVYECCIQIVDMITSVFHDVY